MLHPCAHAHARPQARECEELHAARELEEEEARAAAEAAEKLMGCSVVQKRGSKRVEAVGG